ncbi:outer membrane protein assembly factor BamE [Nitrincola tapanii]|uniref:Outer membrane protein assembly factor BamE n=1 Tax=Nitrincola tapanii TaxID=1708751 RepID=A0A5A9W8M8_9GAMM|nr:outer membrane protein assembly factor BamE [Nitrincola tapanii]KAA0876478.1 outer membrane protein assembly factor BamE [Nitrincola tapanii]
MRKILILLSATLLLSGCFPGVYKIDIPQGNVVTQEMVDQLRPGMTHNQVRYIMGTPLVTDTFTDNRWDYLYSLKPGSGPRVQERITLYFEEGVLVRFSGDFKPTGATNP